jgi:adenylate kinase
MLLLMGLPGSGKGTQGKMMADEHGMHLISMGELIRLYVTGDRRTRMLSGELLDDAEVIDLLDRVLNTIPNKEQCVLDGFPRTIYQAEWLFKKAQQENFSITHVINLEASEDTVKSRLRARGRSDDKEDVITERFKEYGELTRPLINWFKQHDIDVIEINAEKSVYEVNNEVSSTLGFKD